MESFEQDVIATKTWFSKPRFEEITRLYSPRQVVEQRGTIERDYSIAKHNAEAFYQLLTWAEGSFAFEGVASREEPTIFRATMGLLMESMRRQDELRQMRA